MLSGGLLSLRQLWLRLGGFSCYLIKKKSHMLHIYFRANAFKIYGYFV